MRSQIIPKNALNFSYILPKCSIQHIPGSNNLTCEFKHRVLFSPVKHSSSEAAEVHWVWKEMVDVTNVHIHSRYKTHQVILRKKITEKQKNIKESEGRNIYNWKSKSPHPATSSVSLSSFYKRLLVPGGFSIKQEPEYINLSVYNKPIRTAFKFQDRALREATEQNVSR